MAGMPNPELDSLRDEVGKLRKEIQDDRVERYARNLELMRVWMMVYTPLVSLAFLAFAALGWRGLSDIQNNREKFEATSGQAAKLLGDVTAKFESIKKEDEGFREHFSQQNEDNAKIVQQNRAVLGGFKSDLNELERKHGELKATEAHLANDLTGLLGKVQDLTTTSKSLSTSLSSSLSLTTGIGDLLSTSLNLPIITSATVLSDGTLSIQGQGFGSGGKVLMNTQPLSTVAGSTSLSGQVSLPSLLALTASSPIEIPGPATWSDTSIAYADVRKLFSQMFHEDFDKRTTIVGLQVVEPGGQFGTRSSNLYLIYPTPAAPVGLGAVAR
jgi:hypothetical protein